MDMNKRVRRAPTSSIRRISGKRSGRSLGRDNGQSDKKERIYMNSI
jgi:hypothetical protein